MGFDGLPKDYFAFFREIRENNTREWFEANKARFRASVQEPLAAFVEAMAPRLKKISPYFVADPRLNGGSVFRIHKDVRFSKDKTPYKTHGAVQFRHARGKDAHAPGYYVHLDPDEVFFGGGLWLPPPPALRLVREAIRDDGAGWAKATGGKAFLARFGGVEGEALTRPPRGFSADHPMIADIQRKSFFAMAPAKPAAARRPDFVDAVEGAMQDARPLMQFLCRAIEAPF